MTVLVDAASTPEEVDSTRADADRIEAEQRMASLSPLDAAHSAAAADHRWALARLDVVKAS